MRDPLSARWKLPEAVVRLGWISFFADVASEMIYPIVPLFLTAALGAPVVVLGAMEGVAEAIVSVMKGLSGWHCDRLGRRVPYIRWGYGLGGVAKPLLALAFSWPLVFLARAVDRCGKGLRTTARDALIADVVDSAHGGRAYGFHRMMDTAGAVVGVLLATGLLAWLPGHYRTIFLIAAAPGAAAVWLTFRLREMRTNAPYAPSTPEIRCEPPAGKPWSGLPRSYWMTLGLLLVFSFANSSDTLLLLRAKNLGLSDVQTVLAYALFNVLYAGTAYPLGVLSDRFGRWRLVIAGWILYTVVYIGFALSTGATIWIFFSLYGLFMGLTDGVGRALIRDHIPEEKKGTAMGIFHMTTGLTMLVGNIAAGWCWDSLGPRAPFFLGGAVAMSSVFFAFCFAPHARNRNVLRRPLPGATPTPSAPSKSSRR